MVKKKRILNLDFDIWDQSEKVQAMTFAQRGLYLELMGYILKFKDVGIPAKDDDKICKDLKCTREEFEYLKLKVLYEEHNKYYQKKVKEDHGTKVTEEYLEWREKCWQRYAEFYKEQTGLELSKKRDGIQMKALQEIMQTLLESKVGNTYVQVMQGFDLIYNNWNILHERSQQFIKLNQISSSLPNIMVAIKKANESGTLKGNVGKRLDQYQQMKERIENRNSQKQ